ncbi:ABC transporter ATP-binding protein [Rhizobium sp. SSA_523]|uniref:ABC transporter ATP-binding protein n=1 Tax=Rhizobium sp. SSA_523 TaxID=2952477 RepID=UPI00209043F1|nr:ABC transporter ATP-binding protein [Rhizobium sp. SSA_523]MCO5733328.1 ABC transporter ATP-binding protein [Rhizobium sp. SSA_523]WKC21692.1 ABC transporter ATP-binding protein [Rhizobium sp. SSA_523]
MAFVQIQNLTVAFGRAPALRGINLSVERGEAVGLVGESGCGKSVTWLAALGLLPASATVRGSVLVDGSEILGAPKARLEPVRGGRIAMIFQDPAASLNPVHRIGRQIAEALGLHRGLTGQSARAEVMRLLDLVGIPDSRNRINAYPHELSGGQNQRVMIAMALAGEPDLLVADEPTTALDVTIQAQILDLLTTLRRDTGMALVLISHDLGVVAETCSSIAVMYAGRIVEEAPSGQIFARPSHPYTRGLMGALPPLNGARRRLVAIPGSVPEAAHMPQGCAFAPRCSAATDRCTEVDPVPLPLTHEHSAACIHARPYQAADELAFKSAHNARERAMQ